MIRGAFFRRFASSKHTGDAASPISIRGGRSSTTSRETEYFSSIWRARASRRRLVSVRYTVPRRRRGVSIRVEEEAGQKMGRDERDRGTPSPGVFVRVARKGLTGGGVCKSGKQRTYRRHFFAKTRISRKSGRERT